MTDKTVILTGAGPGIRVKVPDTGRVTIASKGKLTEINLTPRTVIKFAA